MTPLRRWMAAILLCGEGAALSHLSAAALWGIERDNGDDVDVVVRACSEMKPKGVRRRVRTRLLPEDVTKHEGIPVTTPARTLLDLAGAIQPKRLERAVNEADKRDLVTPDELRDRISLYSGQPGARALGRLLDRDHFRLSDSELETAFLRLASRAGLRPPTTHASVNGFVVDFYWPDLGLVVETDGLRYHRTPWSQARDRIRDQAHTASGLTCLRFTHWQVKREATRVRQVLATTASRLANNGATRQLPHDGGVNGG